MLNDKTVVITGASGGLGTALAKRFLNEGCYVAGIVRSEKSLNQLKAALDNDRFSGYIADVSDPGAVSRVFSEIAAQRGAVDILFNNAAVYPKINFLEESPQAFLEALAINMGGIANCAKAALPIMIKNGFGRIYNLGSFADLNPIPDSAVYSASKGGVHGLTKAIAADINKVMEPNVDVQVHEWVPGHLKTAMSGFTGNDPDISAGWAVEIVTGKIAATKTSTLFTNNREWLPPRSLKQKLKSKLLFWK